MADPHSGKEQNELTSDSPDLTSRKLTIFGSDAGVRDLVAIVKHEFDLKQREIEMQQQRAAHEHEYSKLTLDAHLAERNAERAAERNARLGTMLFSLLGAVFLAVFLIICMRMGRDQIAIDAIKYLGLVLLSSYSGYQYAARKFSKEKE